MEAGLSRVLRRHSRLPEPSCRNPASAFNVQLARRRVPRYRRRWHADRDRKRRQYLLAQDTDSLPGDACRHKCNNGSTKQTSTSRKNRRRTWRKKLSKTDTKASGFYTGGFGLGHKDYSLPRYHCKVVDLIGWANGHRQYELVLVLDGKRIGRILNFAVASERR